MDINQIILPRYSNLPGDADSVLRILCALISEQPDSVEWSNFGQDEWALLEKMAVEEGVAPIAFHVLNMDPQRYNLAVFDPHALGVLKEQEAITSLRNAVLFKHLFKVLQEFQRASIPVVLLKGVDLAQSVYPTPGLRPMTDIDILVTQSNFRQALTIVNRLGYQKYLPEAFPGIDALVSNHAHLRKVGRVSVLLELHWSLVGTDEYHYAPPMDWFWDNIESSPTWLGNILPGTLKYVHSFNPIANLLLLSAHQMFQHGGESLSLLWLLDIHRLVKSRNDYIDWNILAAQANIFGWGSAIRDFLSTASTCFGTPVPEHLFSNFFNGTDEYNALVDAKSSRSPTRILGEWNKVRSLKLRGKVMMILALIFPTPAYMRMRYHPRHIWTIPFFYLYRWLDITIDAFRTLRIKVRLLLFKS